MILRASQTQTKMDEDSKDDEASEAIASDILVAFDENDLKEIQEVVGNIDAIDQKQLYPQTNQQQSQNTLGITTEQSWGVFVYMSIE